MDSDVIERILSGTTSKDKEYDAKTVASKARTKDSVEKPPNTTTLTTTYFAYLRDLFGAVSSPWWKARISKWLWTIQDYYHFINKTFNAFYQIVFMDWYLIVFNPISSFFGITSFFAVQFAAFAVVVGLGFLRLFGVIGVLNHIRKKYGGGRSLVNMGDPTLFDRYDGIVEKAKHIFTKGSDFPDSLNDGHPDREGNFGSRVRYFNIDVAKTLLLFSAAMYERDDDKITKAILLRESDPEEAQKLEEEAEEDIVCIAKRWGLEFDGISDLNTYGGSYCGLWWDNDSNWIVVAFKGTTPLSGAEWLKDATISKTNGNAFLFGSVHEGFYDGLFPDSQNHVSYSPYGNIVQTVVKMANILKNRRRGVVNVYVTGHSLGSATAATFYARAVKSPDDFGPDVKIRNAYLYGTPRVGDVDFCAGFYSTINMPFGNKQKLFRIVNSWDAVCHLPLGKGDDPERRDYLHKLSIFNYGHIGDEVLITGRAAPRFVGNSFAPGAEIRVVQDSTVYGNNHTSNGKHREDGEESPKKPYPPATIGNGWLAFNPILLAENFIPAPIIDHAPSRYMRNLEKLEPTYTGKQHKGSGKYIG